ncbi:uncharacterized protein [Mytilus edulis]|uniref:uncharacterized protein n=1 Tax=Mytilus edulis TaxID=6550 RepID=UPI0039EEF75B
MTIVNEDLKSAYNKHGQSFFAEKNGLEEKVTGKSVLIVGAGLAGLSAAFELEKVGYNTQILELQHRVGGRTQTLRSGFSDGLHAEGSSICDYLSLCFYAQPTIVEGHYVFWSVAPFVCASVRPSVRPSVRSG